MESYEPDQYMKPHGDEGILVIEEMNDEHRYIGDFALECVDVDENAKVIDLGCGGGVNIERFLELTKNNVDGLDYITSAILEIDGMYTSVFMKDETHREDEYGTQKVESTIHRDENKIKGEFFSFGPHQDSEVKNSMILTFVNGRTIRVQLDDISPEIKKLRKGGEIVIEQKIVINVDDTGSGFVPDVEDWVEEEVEIPI